MGGVKPKVQLNKMQEGIMKKILGMFLWLAMAISLTGCITEFTPKESVIQLEPGESQTFKAVSDDRTAKLVWYLDGKKVAYAKNTYTFTAEANSSDKIIAHKLVVREEGGRYVSYYKLAGLPKDFASSVTWTIKVLPAGCADGETRETTCGVGACAATGSETCANGVFGEDTCTPGTPSEEVSGDGIDNDCDGETDETTCEPTAEVCDGVDNDCDNLVDEEIASTPTTCGIGACASEGELACVNGGMSDSCQPGAPIEEVAGDGIDNDCDGEADEAGPCVPTAEVCDSIDNDCDGAVDDGIASTPTTCGVGACARTGAMSCANGNMSDSCQPGNPVAEVPGDGVDNDCDGEVDETAPCVPTAEVCDGLDNDCDGAADDGIAATPTTCGVGACAGAGQLTCSGGTLVDTCQAGTGSAEVCDGIDNNCDGSVDNGIASQDTSCGLGACARTGELACVSGGMSDSCQPGTPSEEVVGDRVDNDCDGQVDETTCVPVAEICDGIDNDCDQIVDEDIASVPTTCGMGACAGTGTSSCQSGRMVDSCQIGAPSAEVCDNIDNNCNGSVDDGIASVPTTCGVGACASTGTSSCQGGQMVNSCQAGTGSAEVCDNIDNNCNGTVDDGIASVPTTCGVGPCASTGTSSCQGGQMVDSCQAGTGSAEVCDNIDNNCNGTVDDGIASTPTACGVGACSRNGDLACVGGAMVDSCQPGAPGAAEICENTIDDNCDGLTDGQDEVACAAGPPAIPTNVQATDCDPVNYDPAHVNITVTWNASQGADFYRVYRAIFRESNPYQLVADNVAGTSFEYIQTWDEDVYSIIGPTPGLSPTADFDRAENELGPPYAEREAFITALNDYREMALSTLFNFKAPAFFRVVACKGTECSDPSAADAGSAEYIHTAEFSDIAQQVIPSWGYAQLVALADAPPGAYGLGWCGIDLCGSGGGIAMGRVAATTRVNIDVAYENFTEALSSAPGSYFKANGRLGGRMAANDANNGKFSLSGNFTVDLTGRPQVGLGMNARIGFTATDGTRYSEGVASITYKGLTYQFTLPIQPIDGVSGHPAAPPAPVASVEAIPPASPAWTASTAAAPTPLVPEDLDPECERSWPEYILEECPVTIAP
jgi:hypothetical protein